MPQGQIFGMILAGGLSRRMGQEKALMDLAGQPVLAHVIARFGPQTSGLVLNANGGADRFARFGLPVIADVAEFAGAGPLAGILAGLEYAAGRSLSHIACVPCDAPFLPKNLVAALLAGNYSGKICYATGPRGIEPLFALWPVAQAEELRQLLRAGLRKVQEALAALPCQSIAFAGSPGAPDPFTNLNRPQDAQAAHAALTQA